MPNDGASQEARRRSAEEQALWDGALAVLRLNDLGDWTKPAPSLYPHQWSWDSAFIALGLAHVDVDRGLRELETLFAAQWVDGRVPHIVYNPAAAPDAYFPDPNRWACALVNPLACVAPATSGLCQPPVHAIGLWRIWQQHTSNGQLHDVPERARIAALYRQMVAWHRYLVTYRDPECSGLVTIYHPWESGNDNSPRWDQALANVSVGDVPPYTRRDLAHVADPSHRPTDAEYDRFLWLIELLKQARYDDAAIHQTHPFLVKDVMFSAILSAANRRLADVAAWLGAPADEADLLRSWATRAARGVLGQWDTSAGIAFDFDVHAGRLVRVKTWAGLSPLLLADEPEAELPAQVLDTVVAQLQGPAFAGAPGLVVPAVPSTSPGAPGFDRRSYWRGPIWPFANWLLWHGLIEHGRPADADALRAANLDLLRRPGARFAEYFEPYTGEPLGSLDQSWTAAVALDWLAQDVTPPAGAGPG
jgi:hypothetical protein